MHRAHDRPTDRRAGPCRRIGPRDEVFFRPRNPSDSLARRLDEPENSENIISNPSEGKIYERVALSHRIGAYRGVCNRLPGKSTPFSADFRSRRLLKMSEAAPVLRLSHACTASSSMLDSRKS